MVENVYDIELLTVFIHIFHVDMLSICKYTEKLKISPGINNLMANCLVSIKADPAAVPIFHTFHIVNSARLRPGYEAYLKENGLQARRRKRLFAEDGPEYAPV